MAFKGYETANEWLRRQGARATPARVEILGVLLDAESSLTHQQIAALLHRRHRQMDSVTLYRVLEWLVKHEFAHRVSGADRVWRFAAIREKTVFGACETRKDHPHFHCVLCDRVVCLSDFKDKPERMNLPAGFEAYAFHLMIEGRCAACQCVVTEIKEKNEYAG